MHYRKIFLVWASWLACAATLNAATLKVGMVADVSSFKDAGFNQACKAGLEQAMRDFKIEGYFRESPGPGDYQNNLNDLVKSGCGLVIGVGALMQEDLALVAKNNPGIKFALIDGLFYPPLPNVQSLSFQVDQVAFQAGFLAAAWADLQQAQSAQVAYVGGVKIAAVEQFIEPYRAGVEHYNQKYHKQVRVVGKYADTFEDPQKGQAIASALIADGASVIFSAAGQTGIGALLAVKKQAKWGIGVDVDQYYTLPAVKDRLLTSCLKKMDRAVYTLVQAVLVDSYRGAGVMTGTLANDLVALAPYHDFEQQIPRHIKDDILTIREAIRNNRISTGWPVK